MDHTNGEDQDGVSVVGFEVPSSPESSYNNPSLPCDDEAREPPSLPPHLQNTMLNFPASQDDSISLPVPQHVILNHLYIENRGGPRSVVALGTTQRFRSKYVTVVLYTPVPRR
ncbi:SNF1-related protein kinase regulatory subunit beta-3 [Cocos nucifera]|uniref:SNF1-related protein kinase regulatory subunit beta-3 n=1 Tax=Cocos nucifera TaxID=13894 RepID=A0A8K0IL12_COCNU|nr:SNF1-related protein kinase regulatory subunit beta-3 [Cocos nucifera]